MPFRETSRLYDYSTPQGKFQLFISRLSWKHAFLPLCVFLPFLLWIAVVQNYNGISSPVEDNLLFQSAPSENVDDESNKPPIGNYQSLFAGLTYEQEKLNSLRQKEKLSMVNIQYPKAPTKMPKAKYHLVVTQGDLSPDNFNQPGYLINGQSPGPEIRVKQNSSLIVHVTNNLNVPITIHFHGIHQRNSFLSDGVPNVTQEAIPPGGSFIHEINTWPQAGTFFYHAHTAMDILWLYGPMIIEDDPAVYKTWPDEYQYDKDKVFILNGVYHDSLDDLMERIAGPVHSYPAVISSVTINGKSYGEWEDEENMNNTIGSPSSPTGYDITPVEKGLRYRFRFINAASDSLLSCNISSHRFTVIEMDGIYVKPLETDHLVISPGQRYSIIIKMDQLEENYFLSCYHMESPGPRNGLAILNYGGAPEPTKEITHASQHGNETLLLDRWLMDELTPNYALKQTDVYDVPKSCDKEFVIDVFEAVFGEQHVYLLNGHLFENPEVPYFIQASNGVNISNPPQVYEVIQGEVIQYVFQNQRTGPYCFSHPWHIHGHSFYVVGEGPDRYDPVNDKKRIQDNIDNGKTFQFRDSVTVYANQTVGEETDGAFCGWAAVRFVANNPGIWLAHCHVTPHMIMGKKFIIWEHTTEDPRLSKLMSKG